jgi:hypothetical protein
MDKTPTNSIASSDKSQQSKLASREGTYGGFAPVERAAKYEGFRVTAGR